MYLVLFLYVYTIIYVIYCISMYACKYAYKFKIIEKKESNIKYKMDFYFSIKCLCILYLC